MFFPRLRRQAKWMFVFLALVFGVGFVAFGVGSSLPSTGFVDIFQGGVAADEVSAGEARERLEENPNDAQAHLDLSRALQREGKIAEAIPPLERYTQLRPRDQSALQELAGLQTTRANRLQEEAIAASMQAQEASGLGLFQIGESQIANVLRPGPIDEIVVNEANARASEASTNAANAYKAATRAYERLVRLAPRDADYRYLLASSAEQSGDFPKAIDAYRAFLRAAPDANEAQYVRQRLKQLEDAVAAQEGQATVRR